MEGTGEHLLRKLVTIDTETTGLDPKKHALLTAAFVYSENGVAMDYLQVHMELPDSKVVEKEAMEINGINLFDHQEIAETPLICFWRVTDFLNRYFDPAEHITFLGHNISFDLGFISENMPLIAARSKYKIDTAAILQFLQDCGLVKEGINGLQKAAGYFGTRVHLPEHDALSDAMTTLNLYNGLVKFIKEMDQELGIYKKREGYN